MPLNRMTISASVFTVRLHTENLSVDNKIVAEMRNNYCQRFSRALFGNVAEKVGENEENSLDFVRFALVTLLSRPLDAFRRQTLPPQTPAVAPFADTDAYPHTR